MQIVIVAADGSHHANRAVDAAARLAKQSNSQLVILAVGGHVTGAALRRLASTGGDINKILKASVDRILRQAELRAKRVGVTDIKLQSEWGDPAETIIEAVRRLKAKFVVLGRRGHSRLSRLLLGSVSQKVASLAPCIVVVVP
jgi:nucleotide-binding universal stress UspA family protein